MAEPADRDSALASVRTARAVAERVLWLATLLLAVAVAKLVPLADRFLSGDRLAAVLGAAVAIALIAPGLSRRRRG